MVIRTLMLVSMFGAVVVIDLHVQNYGNVDDENADLNIDAVDFSNDD